MEPRCPGVQSPAHMGQGHSEEGGCGILAWRYRRALQGSEGRKLKSDLPKAKLCYNRKRGKNYISGIATGNSQWSISKKTALSIGD